jgi:kinesin family member C1
MKTFNESVASFRWVHELLDFNNTLLICAELCEAKTQWEKERCLRLAAVSEAVTLRGGIRVFIRARNNTAELRATKHDIGKSEIRLSDLAKSKGGAKAKYIFDKVFTQDDHTDADVQRELLLPFLEGAFNGETFFAFAYGETNSGKTYNMNQLIEKVLSSTFEYQKSCQEQETGTVCISAQCIETYTGETAFTFPFELSGSKEKRKIVFRSDVSTNEWVVHEEPDKSAGGRGEPLRKTELRSIDDTQKWFNFAKKHREIRDMKNSLQGNTTGHNERSSRGHLVFKIFVSTTRPDGTTSEGLIFLVDLAGSEETPNPKKDRDAFLESKTITESLNELMTLLGTIRSNARRALLDATDYEIPKFPRGSTLIKALWPVLGRPFPRGVILGTIFAAGRADENNRTLKVLSDVSTLYILDTSRG